MNSKAKGKRGELEVARMLRENGFAGRRGCQYKGGADSPDVVGLNGVHIEVKRTESLRLNDAFIQSFRDAADGEVPVVVHKRNGEPWFITMMFEDFLKRFYKEDEND